VADEVSKGSAGEEKNLQTLFAVFLTVFVAELGDKTQVATLLFATDPSLKPTHVFLAASGALVLATLLAVLIGGRIAGVVPPSALRVGAGVGFIVLGIWMVWK
jgi:putative Ca2+/H+ antiporter (TMEM165/GDT1 family)